MIPYFELSTQLGPVRIQAFGVFVAIGCTTGVWLMQRHGRSRGLAPKPIIDAAVWGLAVGLFTGHWAHLFLYHPEELSRSLLQPLKFWDGLSSMGGVVGGIAAVLIVFAVKRQRPLDYGDSLAFGMAPGWAIARIGCFVVHDHPGVLSNAPWAVAFPAGSRLDMGLIDAFFLGAISLLLWALDRKGLARRRLIGVLALVYGAGRFIEDFFRARDLPYHDARYLGLTPAQFVCIALVAIGAAVLAFAGKEVSAPPAPDSIPPPATSP